MSEVITNLSKAHDTTNQSDENTSVAMILEGLTFVRNKFKMRAFELADQLDATIAKHTEEKAAYEQQAATQLDKNTRNDVLCTNKDSMTC